jgi:hypothetical protein
MATTTNYGWTTPNDTDLVKDGAAAIRTLGSSVDTTTKALNPSTTLGDIEYRSATANTNTRLPIGTTGQILSVVAGVPAWVANDVGDITEVAAGTGISGGGTSGSVTITNSMATAIDAKGDLIGGTGADTFSRLAVGANGTVLTADSAETTGLKWATPAGGASGMTLIQRSTFSNVAGTSTTFDGVFSSSYVSYLIAVENCSSSTQTDDLQFVFRVSGSDAGSGNDGNLLQNTYNSATFVSTSAAGAAYIALNSSQSSTYPFVGQINVSNIGTSTRPAINGMGVEEDNTKLSIFYGYYNSAITATGFRLKSASSNISGTVAVYGLAKA